MARINTLLKSIIWLSLLGVAFGINAAPLKQSAQKPEVFVEGQHFKSIPFAVVESDIVQDLLQKADSKVQVLVFFSYACHWCHKLDPIVEKWAVEKSDNIDFYRVPVEFQASWENLTRAYYTAEALSVLDKTHESLFDAIQEDKLKNTKPDTIEAFFVAQGVDAKKFADTFGSFSLKRQAKWAKSLTQAYKIGAIPGFVVQSKDGAYWASRRMVESDEQMLEVVEYLTKKLKSQAS